MTKEAFDCLQDPIPDELAEQMDPTHLGGGGSGLTPTQVTIECPVPVAEVLHTLADPICQAAAADIRVAIAEHKKAR